jgi:hypothetical protein
MNNFLEWLKEEEFKLWEELHTESLLDVLKGAGGAARGLLRSGKGFMTVGDESLAKMMGDGTKGRMTQGMKDLGGGLRDAIIGSNNKKNTTQSLRPGAVQTSATPKEVSSKIKIKSQTSQPATASKEVSPPAAQKQTSWDDLAKKYNSATSKEEKRRIQVQLAQSDPIKYQQALENAYKLKLRRHAMRSGAARAT